MKELWGATKWMLYVVLNLTFCTSLLVGSSIGGGSLDQFLYVALLFAICSSSLLFIDRLNGTYTVLGVAMAVYFVEFGALDAKHMLQPPANFARADQGINRTDIFLWAGALMQIIGFHWAARITKIRSSRISPKDWPERLFVPIGVMLWTCAAAATLYRAFVVQPDNSAVSIQEGLARLGVWRTTGLMLMGNYAGPLGIMILAYWWAVWKKRLATPLLLVLIFAQFAVGWVVDTKEVAISAPVIALLTRFLVVGKIPMRWLVGSVVAILLVFPIMSAKRVVMTEELRLTPVQALPRTFAILMRTLQERDAISTGKYEQSSETFLERESVKDNVNLIVVGTASGQHDFKRGETLAPLLYALIPRVIWSDKPSESAALLLNREFHLSSDENTFVSPSHLGELYWNFGLTGIVAGMALIGALLGYIGVRFDPSGQPSVSRVLVIILTLYLLVARSEGEIEIQYVLWIRSMVLIGLLHLVLARGVTNRASDSGRAAVRSGALPHGRDLIRFPNLMR